MRATSATALLLGAVVALHHTHRASACDSIGILPSATADGLGGMYGKNADRHRTEAQPISVHPRESHQPGTMIQLDTGLSVPQVAQTFGNAGSRPIWATSYGGYSEGVNEWGVGIGNEFFPSKHLPTDDGRAPQMEFTDLDRLVLERSKTAAEAVQVLTALVSQYGQTCKRCPEAANYNSMFMVVDTAEVYSVMAVGHEWAWKKFDEAATNGTGIWTISNYRFLGATNYSPTAKATAEKQGWWKESDGEFDFGEVYGTGADPSRHKRSMGLLNRLAQDHKLTKADIALTLSDHACTEETAPSAPPVPTPHFHCTEIDEMTTNGGITASSMISDFTTDGRRRIAWHSLTNPSMAVFYPTIFYHDGLAVPPPEWLASSAPWFGFYYATYTLAGTNLFKLAKIRKTWAPIQASFFKQAEAVAVQANELGVDAATALVTTFMANVSSTMHATLLHFNRTL